MWIEFSVVFFFFFLRNSQSTFRGYDCRDDSDQPLSVMPYKVVTNCADARGYTSQWEQFHDQLEPISTSVPYMTAIGNHERDWPGTGTHAIVC